MVNQIVIHLANLISTNNFSIINIDHETDFSWKELSIFEYKDIKIIADSLINGRKSAI